MGTVIEKDYQQELRNHNIEVRNLVLAGLEQIKEGNTKDFDAVCDRLEKKYRDAAATPYISSQYSP